MIKMRMRTPRLWRYTVTGQGEFPFDMLRYDQSWPETSPDAAAITNPSAVPENPNRSVTLLTYNPRPEFDRWRSFVWSPSDLREV